LALGGVVLWVSSMKVKEVSTQVGNGRAAHHCSVITHTSQARWCIPHSWLPPSAQRWCRGGLPSKGIQKEDIGGGPLSCATTMWWGSLWTHMQLA
jgi:hypothetical protein